MKPQAFSAAIILVSAMIMNANAGAMKEPDLQGAWRGHAQGLPGIEATMICVGKFFAVALNDPDDKKFVSTYGGTWRFEGGEWIATLEFHSSNPELVGKELRQKMTVGERTLTYDDPSGKVEWRQLDDGSPGELAGAWLITGRYRDGQLAERTPGVRRTMKILSGTRFQWIAYNIETKEFFGTGGGEYTTVNGKYTESIDFFSRDNSRVGAKLTFDFSLQDGRWRHKGLSSRGEPLDEVWTKREKIGL